ncbi:ATP-binding protein [Flavobacterium sp. Sd200]|uniref:ATP-binding protein n=1 Tax=Flavobacterium sp. Sd200 TaxID=2692211 RepID=UPI0013711910|nr:ATP-binding protein [Flavobacterium sp. Sd200]MXN90978.1 ATP-binding protein [Flavobacterium sp. Sd200]
MTLILIIVSSCKRSAENAAFKKIDGFLEKGSSAALEDSLKEAYLDSAYVLLSDFKNDSVSRQALNKTALNYYYLSKYNKAIAVSKKSLSLATDANDSISMARALYISGISYYENTSQDSAFAAYKHAEKLYAKLNDPDLGRIILYKAYIYYDIGEFVLCETEAFKALRELQEQKVNTEIYNCYNLIANALDGQDNNADAIKYFKLALEQIEKFKAEGYSVDVIDAYRASCYNNMGRIYVKMKQYDKAIQISKEGIEFSHVKKTSPNLYAKLLSNLAYAKFKQGNYSDLPTMFFQSLRIRDSLNNMPGMVSSRIYIGEYYIAVKDTLKGIEYLQRAYRDANTINSSTDRLTCLKMLADVDKTQSSYYSEKYIQLNDSLQQKAKLNRNRFARIEYETDRLVVEKEALARKNTFIIGVSVIVLLFVAAIFIIYYLNSRNKELLHIQEQQKANEEIYMLMFEQQGQVEGARAEEKNRIAMELHDGILNNIYAVRLNLEFTNKKTDEKTIEERKGYIKELQHIETEIRAVSHDLSRNIAFNQDKSFESILEYMITSQKNNFNTRFDAEIDTKINWELLPNTHKVNVYRIIQEVLQNVNKYSQAKNVVVIIKQDDGFIAMSISDDGVGFNTAIAAEGIGLKNLKKRSEALGGKLDIESAPGAGATISVRFPVVT